MYLDELLSLVPSDTEDLVERARERANQMVRDVLRQETALRLRRPESDEQITVRIRTKPGLPVSLQQKEIEERDRIAALIAPFRRSLTTLRESGTDVLKLVNVLQGDPCGSYHVDGGPEHLQAVWISPSRYSANRPYSIWRNGFWTSTRTSSAAHLTLPSLFAIAGHKGRRPIENRNSILQSGGHLGYCEASWIGPDRASS